ncbi:uncharacterized protein G2W53_021688 [Senna tora]|uniref:Uncharacterized protein n=1 Tax=Senna tora TaxID=362788 RepID=A0A834TT95_9FABA|nr:uncharacterized protein G2W53_021688 [Senna tora]
MLVGESVGELKSFKKYCPTTCYTLFGSFSPYSLFDSSHLAFLDSQCQSPLPSIEATDISMPHFVSSNKPGGLVSISAGKGLHEEEECLRRLAEDDSKIMLQSVPEGEYEWYSFELDLRSMQNLSNPDEKSTLMTFKDLIDLWDACSTPTEYESFHIASICDDEELQPTVAASYSGEELVSGKCDLAPNSRLLSLQECIARGKQCDHAIQALPEELADDQSFMHMANSIEYELGSFYQVVAQREDEKLWRVLTLLKRSSPMASSFVGTKIELDSPINWELYKGSPLLVLIPTIPLQRRKQSPKLKVSQTRGLRR